VGKILEIAMRLKVIEPSSNDTREREGEGERKRVSRNYEAKKTVENFKAYEKHYKKHEAKESEREEFLYCIKVHSFLCV
jgi:hypothetical protein